VILAPVQVMFLERQKSSLALYGLISSDGELRTLERVAKYSQ